MPKPTAILEIETEEVEDLNFESPTAPSYNQMFGFPPHELLDSESVRPGESKQEHKKRISDLIDQIKEDGQRQPVTVKQEPDGKYRVVDGQGRTEALRLLDRPVWCVRLEPESDAWSAAVKLNVQRKNYNDLQLALLMKEARTRLNLNGKQVAAMFGIKEPLLVEYGKIADAPKEVQEAIQTGELNRSAALKLMQSTPKATPERRKQVVEKAKEIAASNAAPVIKSQVISQQGKLSKSLKAVDEHVKEVAAPRVQARHIAEAARAVAAAANEPTPALKRSKSEILAALRQLSDLMPLEDGKLDDARMFLVSVQQFADGEVSPRQLQNRWNKLIVITERRRGQRS